MFEAGALDQGDVCLLVCFFVYLLKMKIYLTLQLEDSDEEDEDSEEAWERPPSLYETQDLPIREGYLMMRGQQVRGQK